MVVIDWRGGENDGGGGIVSIRENDGGGRAAGPGAQWPLIGGPLPAWNRMFDSITPKPVLHGAAFPPDGWDPAITLEMLAASFAASSAWKIPLSPPPGHPGSVPLPPITVDPDPAKAAQDALVQDVDALRTEMADQAEKLDKGEVEFQAVDILSYFRKLLACSPEVRGASDAMIRLALRVGTNVSRHYKLHFMRARPAQVAPWLVTAIPTPRHPSYPSGHALQSFLIARAIGAFAPGKYALAVAIATRIARNREVAGLHFPSDTAVSRDVLAPAVWGSLAAFPGVPDWIKRAELEHPKETMLPLP